MFNFQMILCEGSFLLWLDGDTRSMGSDRRVWWIQRIGGFDRARFGNSAPLYYKIS